MALEVSGHEFEVLPGSIVNFFSSYRLQVKAWNGQGWDFANLVKRERCKKV